MTFVINFADGIKHILYPADVELLKDTRLHKILIDKETYIPRYGVTFTAFMHFIYGYKLSIQYIRRICRNIPPAEFLEMMLADNHIYGIEDIHLPIISLLYEISPKTLDKDSLILVFSKKSEHERSKHTEIVYKIREIEDELSEHMDDFKPVTVFEWMNIRKLRKIHDSAINKLEYYKFRSNMRSRLPYVFIGLADALATYTGKTLSENYQQNIKTRLRNDEGIILELYIHMKKTGISYTSQALLSVLTNLFIS